MFTEAASIRTLHWFLTILTVILFLHALFPPQPKPIDLQLLAKEECKGDPIYVPMEYNGTVLDPWSCQEQCGTQKQRYLIYTNGRATQCEQLPGCNDFGEDRGETCRIPAGVRVPGSSAGSSEVLFTPKV